MLIAWQPKYHRFYALVLICFFSKWLLRSRQKNEYFTVRLTVRITPSPPLLTVICLWIFFGCVFYLRLWFYVFWNGFYTRKVIFIQLQEFLTPWGRRPITPFCESLCTVFVFLSHDPRQTHGDEMKTVQKPVMTRVEKAGQRLVVGPMWPIWKDEGPTLSL